MSPSRFRRPSQDRSRPHDQRDPQHHRHIPTDRQRGGRRGRAPPQASPPVVLYLKKAGVETHRRPGSTLLSVITPALGSRANSRRYTGDPVKYAVRRVALGDHGVGSPKSSSPSLAPRRKTNRRRSAQRVPVL